MGGLDCLPHPRRGPRPRHRLRPPRPPRPEGDAISDNVCPHCGHEPGPDYRALYLEAVAALREVTQLHHRAAEATGSVVTQLIRHAEDEGACTPAEARADLRSTGTVVASAPDDPAARQAVRKALYSGPHGDYTVHPAAECHACDPECTAKYSCDNSPIADDPGPCCKRR